MTAATILTSVLTIGLMHRRACRPFQCHVTYCASNRQVSCFPEARVSPLVQSHSANIYRTARRRKLTVLDGVGRRRNWCQSGRPQLRPGGCQGIHLASCAEMSRRQQPADVPLRELSATATTTPDVYGTEDKSRNRDGETAVHVPGDPMFPDPTQLIIVGWTGDDDPENPYNWPLWQINVNAQLLTFLAFLTPLASCKGWM
jgi:hypothetical protein